MPELHRPLQTVVVDGSPAAVFSTLDALRGALDGTGSAVLPVPDGPPAEVDALRGALQPDLPVEEDVAVVVATSGSTGPPKGVLLSTAALRASAAGTHERLGGAGQWLLAMPVRYVAGLQVLVRSLLAGTEPVTLDLREGFRADAFVAAAGGLGDGGRYTALVPTQLRRLLDAGDAAVDALRGFDAVLLGGSAAPAALLDAARAAGVAVVPTYGMSETCGGCVYDGEPLAGVRWQLDADGRVLLGGPVLARGYRLRPDLTAAAFRDGWFRTGDLGRRGPDGRLVVLGRVDDVVVTGGEKVAVHVVEEALRAHPGVRDCAVAGLPDADWGQRVHAWVVPADPDQPPGAEDLRAYVAARLPRAAVPRGFTLVGALPLLASGKIDRRALTATGG